MPTITVCPQCETVWRAPTDSGILTLECPTCRAGWLLNPTLTEREWLACEDRGKAVGWLFEARVSPRKLRLYGTELLREVWDQVLDERSRRAVEIAERYAEGDATEEELSQAQADAWRAMSPEYPLSVAAHRMAGLDGDGGNGVRAAVEDVSGLVIAELMVHRRYYPADPARWPLCWKRRLDELLGPTLFRTISIPPAVLAWSGGTVRALADDIYNGRAFDQMPILGDALEEVGCTDPEILDHCRGAGLHFKGCWVVDLVLGKEPTLAAEEFPCD